MIYTTINLILNAGAHPDCRRLLKLLKALDHKDYNKPIPLDFIMKSNGLGDVLWLFEHGCDIGDNKDFVCNWAIWCAYRVLPIFEAVYPDDKRPRIALETAEKYLSGNATLEELHNARIESALAYRPCNDFNGYYAARAANAVTRLAISYTYYPRHASRHAASATDYYKERKAQTDKLLKMLRDHKLKEKNK